MRPPRARAWVLQSGRAAWSAAFVAAFCLYALTAHWQTEQVSDAQAAVWPAWQLINAGTLDLAGVDKLPNLPWFGEVDGRVVSYRTMGVILGGVPFALVAHPFGLDPMQVSALAAVTYTALAVANMLLVFRSMVSSTWAALATATLAVGTPLWTTAAAELWTHGPDAFWLSCALLAMTRGHLAVAGAAFAPAIMVRPHLAVAAAACGLVLSWRARSLRPALLVGVPASTALPIMYAWSSWYYGAPTVAAGYQGRAASAVAAPAAPSSWLFVQDAAGAFLSPASGLLLYSPVIALLLLLARRGWRIAPPWACGALIGAIAYQVVQLRVNRYSGGGGFYSNRLVVEFVVLSAPVWLLGLRSWVDARPHPRRMTAALLAATGVAIHAFGAVNAYYWQGTLGDWYIWYPKIVFDAMGVTAWPVAASLCLIPVVAVLQVRRWEQGLASRGGVTVPQQPASPRVAQRGLSSGAPAAPPGAAASPRR